MAKDFAKPFYNSKAWLACRNSYIQKRIMVDGAMCEMCHNKAGYILHHKTELTRANIKNPDIALNHCNLEYVCKECHDKVHYNSFHKVNSISVRPCVFDEHGQIIATE